MMGEPSATWTSLYVSKQYMALVTPDIPLSLEENGCSRMVIAHGAGMFGSETWSLSEVKEVLCDPECMRAW